jgi:hypothetical protein
MEECYVTIDGYTRTITMPEMDLESLPIALPDGVDYDENVIGTYLVTFPFLRNPAGIPYAQRWHYAQDGS